MRHLEQPQDADHGSLIQESIVVKDSHHEGHNCGWHHEGPKRRLRYTRQMTSEMLRSCCCGCCCPSVLPAGLIWRNGISENVVSGWTERRSPGECPWKWPRRESLSELGELDDPKAVLYSTLGESCIFRLVCNRRRGLDVHESSNNVRIARLTGARSSSAEVRSEYTAECSYVSSRTLGLAALSPVVLTSLFAISRPSAQTINIRILTS